METVPNQKVVQIQKEKVGKNNLYAVISLKGIDDAATLPKTAFKLWIYLVKNQDKYSFALSCKDFCRWAGVSKNTYETAVKELIERSYLVRKEEGSNVYIFYEIPQDDEVIMIENPAGSVSEKQAFCF